jgi:phage terminase large subunit
MSLVTARADGSTSVDSPSGAMNSMPNPWFTPELEEERQLDLRLYPERYDHIWEGEYAKAFEGAYFAKQLAQAKAEGRIDHVGADPLLPYKAFFDLGGTGARADALAIWIVQFVGREIRVLGYIEGVGQEVGYYVSELRKRKYEQALLVLPHDGNAHAKDRPAAEALGLPGLPRDFQRQ